MRVSEGGCGGVERGKEWVGPRTVTPSRSENYYKWQEGALQEI